MTDSFPKITDEENKVVDWPEKLMNASEVNLFDEVVAALKGNDNINEKPSK